MTKALLWLAALALGGCALTPAKLGEHAGRDDFSLVGRAAVRSSERAEVLRVEWKHLAGVDALNLSTSLGQTVAEIELAPGRAKAVLGDGRTLEEQDDAALARSLLGTPIPLRRLAAWVRGKALDGHAVERDAQGRVRQLNDEGWLVAYSGYGDAEAGDELPTLIDARKGELGVRLKIEQWRVGHGHGE
jgi:outer membrane lipoprotein LolB